MNYAFTNGKILNGTKDMQIQTGLCILVRDGKIYDIIKDTADLDGYKIIDLKGITFCQVLSICMYILREAENPRRSSATMKNL